MSILILDILYEIFQYFSIQELSCNSIFLVNKDFYEVFRNNGYLWFLNYTRTYEYKKQKFCGDVDYYELMRMRKTCTTKMKRHEEDVRTFMKDNLVSATPSSRCGSCCLCQGKMDSGNRCGSKCCNCDESTYADPFETCCFCAHRHRPGDTCRNCCCCSMDCKIAFFSSFQPLLGDGCCLCLNFDMDFHARCGYCCICKYYDTHIKTTYDKAYQLFEDWVDRKDTNIEILEKIRSSIVIEKFETESSSSKMLINSLLLFSTKDIHCVKKITVVLFQDSDELSFLHCSLKIFSEDVFCGISNSATPSGDDKLTLFDGHYTVVYPYTQKKTSGIFRGTVFEEDSPKFTAERQVFSKTETWNILQEMGFHGLSLRKFVQVLLCYSFLATGMISLDLGEVSLLQKLHFSCSKNFVFKRTDDHTVKYFEDLHQHIFGKQEKQEDSVVEKAKRFHPLEFYKLKCPRIPLQIELGEKKTNLDDEICFQYQILRCEVRNYLLGSSAMSISDGSFKKRKKFISRAEQEEEEEEEEIEEEEEEEEIEEEDDEEEIEEEEAEKKISEMEDNVRTLFSKNEDGWKRQDLLSCLYDVFVEEHDEGTKQGFMKHHPFQKSRKENEKVKDLVELNHFLAKFRGILFDQSITAYRLIFD